MDCSCTVTRTASRTTRSNYWTIYRIVAQSRAIDTPRYRHKKPTDHDTRRTNRRLIQSTSKPSGLTVTRSKTDQLLNRYTDIDDINSTSDRRSIARELQKYTSIMIQQYGDHVDTAARRRKRTMSKTIRLIDDRPTSRITIRKSRNQYQGRPID